VHDSVENLEMSGLVEGGRAEGIRGRQTSMFFVLLFHALLYRYNSLHELIGGRGRQRICWFANITTWNELDCWRSDIYETQRALT